MASPDPSLLSLNTATISKQWTLAQAIEGCARHGIRGIAPWRDKLAEMGVREAANAIKAHGLTVSGLCRGGFFTAKNWLDDNRRAIEEAHELGAQCALLPSSPNASHRSKACSSVLTQARSAACIG